MGGHRTRPRWRGLLGERRQCGLKARLAHGIGTSELGGLEGPGRSGAS